MHTVQEIYIIYTQTEFMSVYSISLLTYTDTAVWTHSVSQKNWENYKCTKHRLSAQNRMRNWHCTELLIS